VRAPTVAVVRRGAPSAWDRLVPVFEALGAVGIVAVPIAYDETKAEQVRAQLAEMDGVLVWVDPLHEGKTRTALDVLLREVAAGGTWVSTHPDTIDKMGVKEVLYRTRHLGWGSDVELYRTREQFHAEFPPRVRSAGPRVLKPSRGNGGRRVWKVAQASDPDRVVVLEALRGSVPETLAWSELLARIDPYFAGGAVIDQAYEPRLVEGMIRCYVAADRVVGFGTQQVSQLLPAGPDTPRVMHAPHAEPFAALRRAMEGEWIPQMMSVLGISQGDMPVLWDADFFGVPANESFVLCEINVSSVIPFPEAAPAAIAALVAERLGCGGAA